MKKLIFLVIAAMLFSLLISNFAFSEMTEIKVGKGTLKIGGILQAGFTYHVEDKEGTDQFTLNRARFLFWGVIVPDKVKYFVQLEHNKGVGVLDYKAQFFYIPQTEITFGRFLPNFTLYMPYSTAKLEMISYPLFIYYKDPKTDKYLYAPWRQVGIQTTTKTDYVDFNLGIFNGADQTNNTSDNNDAKDFLARVDFKPPVDQAQIRVGGYAWIGSALPQYSKTWKDTIVVNSDTVFQDRSVSKSFPDETLKMNRFGGFARVDYKATENVTVKFRGEFLTASTENLFFAHVDSVATTDAQAYFAHVGIKPDPRVEFLVRYDFHDPDTDRDDDAVSWFTGGVNYYLEGINAMFYLNYIHKMEEGTEVDNDIVQGQVQITF
ncbi:MAG: hypothetical protein KAW02_02405 [candidate division Zixibacteria bacterium]|nr:hypothetical protein [candidate division Zixibacteria bacterium]